MDRVRRSKKSTKKRRKILLEKKRRSWTSKTSYNRSKKQECA